MAGTMALYLCAGIVAHLALAATGNLHIREVEVPPLALAGDDVHLRCHYESQGSRLYSFKWYKDDHEIYRHRPGVTMAPTDRCLNDKGDVLVDCWQSTEQDVVLRGVGEAASGEYKCEVMSDSPHFTKKQETAKLRVYSEPLLQPVVTGVEDAYSPLSLVTLNCSSPNTQYRPALHWAVNGHPAQLASLHPYDERTLGLSFPAQRHLFVRGVITATCTATLGDHRSDHTVRLANTEHLTAQGFQYNTGSWAHPCTALLLAALLLHP